MTGQPMRYPPVRELSSEECWDRLRTTVVGRLAIAGDAYPEMFPVNYVVDRGTLVFRSDPGAKIAASLDGARVAFEVDAIERVTGEAWSVVVKGGLEPVLATTDVLDALGLPLFPWQYGAKAFFVRIVPVSLSGRRFVVADPAHWVTQITGIQRAAEE
ncbi:pyridoxamine 5'-phosphate oxidase family protein [Sinomonas sp. ASV322]|uniref:pyridoxamine 5'-phosphate oxidase family protein n=1 Tax=Sinomonas sp. ASV322 TaxID=3041920 RepID=UPI0027DCFDE6|nr:pyridoxamine 5'-phosphate oxidase family protein [Sinomonas sp. ASV322]MDQ4501373.1 pyridoxamine 5'-phosphate oxidase family protein [Sinomonas sp. ASV322]